MSCFQKGTFGQKVANLSSNGWIPCGPANTGAVVPCCNKGDICLSNNICHFTHQDKPVSSGYYTAGCTDKTANDINCLGICSKSSRYARLSSKTQADLYDIQTRISTLTSCTMPHLDSGDVVDWSMGESGVISPQMTHSLLQLLPVCRRTPLARRHPPAAHQRLLRASLQP